MIHTDTGRAVLLIIVAVFLLSVSDALIKASAADFSMWQLYVLRSGLATLLLLVPLFSAAGRGALVPRSWAWVYARSVLVGLMWVAFYAALPLISLSLAALAIYTTPLFIALFSAISGHEQITRRKGLAILVGFAGVLITLSPGAEGFSPWVLLPVLAAVFYAWAAVLTKTRCLAESTLALSFAANFTLLLMGLVGTAVFWAVGPWPEPTYRFLLGTWGPMSGSMLALMGLLAVLAVVVTAAIARAYQLGETSVVGAFDYVYLVFAVMWGALLFDEHLTLKMFAGLLLIVASGLSLLVPAKANT